MPRLLDRLLPRIGGKTVTILDHFQSTPNIAQRLHNAPEPIQQLAELTPLGHIARPNHQPLLRHTYSHTASRGAYPHSRPAKRFPKIIVESVLALPDNIAC